MRSHGPARDQTGGSGALLLAAFMAAISWPTLMYEFGASVMASMARGDGPIESVFLFFHFFSILTNIGIALLMSVTALRLVRGRALPAARLYNAGLVYILVTGVTYELLLRRLYAPHDLRALTNAIIHDVMPTLTFLFWLVFAPRHGTRWVDALWMLAYPAAYLAMTLVAGALGEPYPYSFLDVGRLGGAHVALVAVGFLTVFSTLGLAATAAGKMMDRNGPETRPPERSNSATGLL